MGGKLAGHHDGVQKNLRTLHENAISFHKSGINCTE
jgi:hypothetical protein